MDKSKIEKALETVRGKLATGGTFFGHDIEQVEKALEEAFEAEKTHKSKNKKKADE